MSNPARVNVTLTLTGLSGSEAEAVLTELPPGRWMSVEASQPVHGGRRYEIAAHDLSLMQAEVLTGKLREHMQRVVDDQQQPKQSDESRPRLATGGSITIPRPPSRSPSTESETPA